MIWKKLYQNLINNRLKRESVQRELENKLISDISLTEEQFAILYNIIHCGAYYILHGIYTDYIEEAEQYQKIVNSDKNDIDILYQRFRNTFIN